MSGERSQRGSNGTLSGLEGRQSPRPMLAAVRLLIALPFLLPALWRMYESGLTELRGIFSDLAMGAAVLLIALIVPRFLRLIILLVWGVFQVASLELYMAIRRLPCLEDFSFLADPVFIKGSVSTIELASPGFALVMALASITALASPAVNASRKLVGAGLTTTLLLLFAHGSIHETVAEEAIADRYNGLHWLVAGAFSDTLAHSTPLAERSTLPASLRSLDLQGKQLLADGESARARNVLIITLEGISGIYLPDIRNSMGVPEPILQMNGLAKETQGAMLVPDFVTHSHQTIRGLYALHCGDFSKFSFATPKAFEVQSIPERASQCLPAQLAAHGWQTHFLQGAPLQFMNKDRVMPAIGFQETHGLEWFPTPRTSDFLWGASDEEFFGGARRYVNKLQESDKPWLLSLLTVATHQPFDATEELIEKYGSRKLASVALLDKAAAEFLNGLKQDGVLEDTLVIVTSDESHGAEGADWYSSWGMAAVIAPEQEKLPRLKSGTYGLVDIEASILDYLGLPMPEAIIGRSLFRDYANARDMISYTAGKLRWQSSDNHLYECGKDGNCRENADAAIIGPRSVCPVAADHEDQAARLFAMAELLDNSLRDNRSTIAMQFADGEVRELPETITNDWTDNLIGAQYLDFPKDSRVEVDIRIKALEVQQEGVQLKLTLRQFEQEVESITLPPFPLLHSGEECHIGFSFTNEQARQAFSFHLLGAGQDSSLQFDKFEVLVHREG